MKVRDFFCKLRRAEFFIIYNYFTGKLRKFYLTKGSQDQFCLQNIQSSTKGVLLWDKLVEGTRVKFPENLVINNFIAF